MSTLVEFKGYALTDSKRWGNLEVISLKPKAFKSDDVEITITHCGGWGESKLPLILGHEIVGKVTRVGDNVKDIKVGDPVGVGAHIGSCMSCSVCKSAYENYCVNGIPTHNGEYSDGVFVFSIPDETASPHALKVL
ncbi:hypothetical protein POSPLADRAFT_1052976 [Postia placenta MAD-698-R-SB12]|uniref:Alcohol dehydrogenase-like N-terminal domain-containing protein n=1 Tax=Postia placenta MAD-698-R-SB12 TaxID=670580 RepID=A0A1X6NCV4_9APHY|nr:hypothetical protein POSPLADRAFT_1052976 [Postia placenta MAD-698-R-SB12]OSX66322.1 hypothetical protein POSPLADRAFT_1052976 [Postia placenta MAD-698-R-SB12]